MNFQKILHFFYVIYLNIIYCYYKFTMVDYNKKEDDKTTTLIGSACKQTTKCSSLCFCHNFVQELLQNDYEKFFGAYRMWPEQFDLLVNLLHPHFKKNILKPSLPTELRLAVTLLYLSQGDNAKLKHAEFGIGKSTVHKIVNETCWAIWTTLQPIVLKPPSKEDWIAISEDFMKKWQFPNCLGALDGRYMTIQAPPNSGSAFYNYKQWLRSAEKPQFFNMILLAVCDATYKFTWVNIEQRGSISDDGVWANTKLASSLAAGDLLLPDPTLFPETNTPFPFVFIGDEAFPLSTHMMRPYPREKLTDDMRIFNYRLLRVRRTIENAFGILTARWRILHKPLYMSITNCENVLKALVCLHNFIMLGEEHESINNRQYCTTDLIDIEKQDGGIREGQWRQHFSPHFIELGRMDANHSIADADSIAKEMRNTLKEYFISSTNKTQALWQY
ncbi:PREDICTED: uncharacterized protein LOC105149654 [Acromyrmex echinatior]|nr:PREDICTED: uncharacterized protein LOC105149654 [Acromyrmex echinatior]